MFQTFNESEGALAPQKPSPRPAEEARVLLGRYPNLSPVELARLINLYRELSALDMALMLSDEELSSRVDSFSADHRSKLRPPFRHYAALIAYAVVGLVVLVWAATASA